MYSTPRQLSIRLDTKAVPDNGARSAGGQARTTGQVTVTDCPLWSQTGLSRQLSILTGRNILVRLTNNSHTMLSTSEKKGALVLRLHRMFTFADSAVLRSLAAYLTDSDPRASGVIDDFIARNQSKIAGGTRRIRVRMRGRHHDLRQSLIRVIKQCFGKVPEVRITWGKRSRILNPSSVQLGSYSYDERLIRIHPVLDSDRVPWYFLDWVVYHELLHHVLPRESAGGRKRIHDSRFRRFERAFPLYRDAVAWEDAHLDELLNS